MVAPGLPCRPVLHTALGAAAAVVSLAFCLSTLERWVDRRSRHEAAWTVALGMFSVASAALAWGSASGWDGATFRVFYLFGAITNVPFLALGTIELLAAPRVASVTRRGVWLLAAFAAGVLATTPFTGPVPAGELARGSEVFGPLPRILAAAGSGIGALVVIGGALWSITRRRLVAANALIATGTMISGASGLFTSVADETTAFAVALLLGIVVIFAGFLVAAAGRRPQASSRLSSLPLDPWGSDDTKSTLVGHL